jgi:ParB family transcriptional regulator, chromosome partitioning protein
MAVRSLKDTLTDRTKNLVSPEIIDIVDRQEEITVDSSLIEMSFTFTPDHRPLRHYYDMERIKAWASSDIKKNGVLTALWVRPHPSKKGVYELVAGMRRLLAAQFLGTTVPIKVFKWSNDEAYAASLSENANREDFTALEEVDLILALLSNSLNLKVPEVIKALYKIENEDKGKSPRELEKEEIRNKVFEIFNAYGQIRFSTFVTKRLNLINCKPEILEKIRTGAITCTAGMEISKVKDQNDCETLLCMAVDNNLTVSQIKNHVRGLSKDTKNKVPLKTEIKTGLDRLRKVIHKKKLAPAKAQKIEDLMALIERELADDT